MPLNGKFLDKSGLTYLWSKLKDLFSGKVDKETGKGLSSNDYTTSEKTKLNGIETGANKTIVDSEMSSSSTNPVQNKVINAALSELTVAEDADRVALIAQVDGGAKNKLPMTHAGGSITRYGVTCTWDLNAGTMILNGTHRSGDSAAIFEFYDGSAEDTTILPAGSYVITGCPTGGSTSTYRAMLTQIAGAVDTGNGRSFELSEPHYAAYRVLISGNVAFNNMVFKPMVCSQEDYAISPAFVPYAPTNRELWQKINAIKRTYKVPISSTPINGIYFGVQMFPFEFDSVPEGTVEVQNIGQGGTAIDPTKFTTQINTWGFRIYTTDSAYAGLIPDVKIL